MYRPMMRGFGLLSIHSSLDYNGQVGLTVMPPETTAEWGIDPRFLVHRANEEVDRNGEKLAKILACSLLIEPATAQNLGRSPLYCQELARYLCALSRGPPLAP